MKLDVYDNIINDVRSMPKRKPRPKPEPVKFTQKVKKVFTSSVSVVAEDIFAVLARSVIGEREMESRIPLSKLQNRIAHHAAIMFARSINRGEFCRVMYLDNYLVIFDYGDSRIVEMGAQIYMNPKTEDESMSAITVKETELRDPWDKVFHRDEIEFDLVPETPFDGDDIHIVSADLHEVKTGD